ncbi:hypothetical protein E4T56_gene11372 [Termitomyces sp. T112]|nr:hypothetical protein E4T56_gene11372 [Termitomyces sp. T112]
MKVSGSADPGSSAALDESLLGRHDPLALATRHSKVFWTLIACVDSTVHGQKFGGVSGVLGNWEVAGQCAGVQGTGRDITPPSASRPFETRGAEWELAGRGSRSQAILISPQQVIAAWETKSKCGRRFVRVLFSQLKALYVPQDFPNFVMSSPSIPVVSSADLDECQGPESVVHGGGGVFSEGPEADKFCPALPKEGSMGWSAGKAGFLQGGRGKGASSVVIRGKHQASPSSGAGPSKRLRGRELSAGPPESRLFSPTPGVPLEWLSSPPTPIPLITEGELQQVREDRDVVRMEKEAMEQERNTLVHVATEQALEVRGLWKRLMQMEGQPTGGAEGRGQVPGGDALWAELEAARRREDWLANEAASGHVGILHELSSVPPFVTDGSFSGVRLGVGASGPLGRCLHGIRVDSGWVDAGVHGSAPRVAAGDGTIGEVAGGASVTQCSGPGVVVGGGG